MGVGLSVYSKELMRQYVPVLGLPGGYHCLLTAVSCFKTVAHPQFPDFLLCKRLERDWHLHVLVSLKRKKTSTIASTWSFEQDYRTMHAQRFCSQGPSGTIDLRQLLSFYRALSCWDN